MISATERCQQPCSSFSKYNVLPSISTPDHQVASQHPTSIQANGVIRMVKHGVSKTDAIQESRAWLTRAEHSPPQLIDQSKSYNRRNRSNNNGWPQIPLLLASPLHVPKRSVTGRNPPQTGHLESDRSCSTHSLDEVDDNDRIVLAVKIPSNGDRHCSSFHRSDSLRCVLQFAEEVSQQRFDQHTLAQTWPRRQFPNLSVSIGETGIENRSVLHVEESL